MSGIKSKHFKLLLATLFSLALYTLSCKKDPNLLVADATVVDMGSPAGDGCGWMLKIDTTYYSPKTLPDQYKKAELKVNISYNLLTTKYQCGIAANLFYKQIDIKTIKAQ